jgi:hypothetical protein
MIRVAIEMCMVEERRGIIFFSFFDLLSFIFSPPKISDGVFSASQASDRVLMAMTAMHRQCLLVRILASDDWQRTIAARARDRQARATGVAR